MNAWRRDCGRTPLRASIRMMARSAVEAPVAMLRVYCSWPGVSAMMNLRLRRGEVAIGDVDGDALFALGAQAVGQQREIDGAGRLIHRRFLDGAELVFVDALGIVKQAADQRRFAVIHAAAGGEAEQVFLLFAPQERVDSGQCFGACGHLEIAFPLLDLHRAFLIVIDDAVLALRAAERASSLR